MTMRGNEVKDPSAEYLPLAGIRIVDFTWVMAGPAMTMILADLGAEVIKIESRSRMDGTRKGRPMFGASVEEGDRGDWPELQPLFHALNRNKRSITLNLQKAAAVDLVMRLISMSDAVVDNFSAGTLTRMGFGYDVLTELNPAVVALSISGAGQVGPVSDAILYNPLAIGLSGLASLVGYEGEQPTARLSGMNGDTNVAMYSAMALMAALLRAKRTGQGDYIDASQWEASICGLDLHFADFQFERQTPLPTGNCHPWFAPHGVYQCEGEDNWIALHCETEDEWATLCRILGVNELTEDVRFCDPLRRLSNRLELDERLNSATLAHNKIVLATELQAAGVSAAPVLNTAEQFEQAHFQERGVHRAASHPKVEYELLPALPWTSSRAGRGRLWRAAPLLGQDNEYVLGDLLGLDSATILQLQQDEIIE